MRAGAAAAPAGRGEGVGARGGARAGEAGQWRLRRRLSLRRLRGPPQNG